MEFNIPLRFVPAVSFEPSVVIVRVWQAHKDRFRACPSVDHGNTFLFPNPAKSRIPIVHRNAARNWRKVLLKERAACGVSLGRGYWAIRKDLLDEILPRLESRIR